MVEKTKARPWRPIPAAPFGSPLSEALTWFLRCTPLTRRTVRSPAYYGMSPAERLRPQSRAVAEIGCRFLRTTWSAESLRPAGMPTKTGGHGHASAVRCMLERRPESPRPRGRIARWRTDRHREPNGGEYRLGRRATSFPRKKSGASKLWRATGNEPKQPSVSCALSVGSKFRACRLQPAD